MYVEWDKNRQCKTHVSHSIIILFRVYTEIGTGTEALAEFFVVDILPSLPLLALLFSFFFGVFRLLPAGGLSS